MEDLWRKFLSDPNFRLFFFFSGCVRFNWFFASSRSKSELKLSRFCMKSENGVFHHREDSGLKICENIEICERKTRVFRQLFHVFCPIDGKASTFSADHQVNCLLLLSNYNLVSYTWANNYENIVTELFQKRSRNTISLDRLFYYVSSHRTSSRSLLPYRVLCNLHQKSQNQI